MREGRGRERRRWRGGRGGGIEESRVCIVCTILASLLRTWPCLRISHTYFEQLGIDTDSFEQRREAVFELLEAGDRGGFGRRCRLAVEQILDAQEACLKMRECLEGRFVEGHLGLFR